MVNGRVKLLTKLLHKEEALVNSIWLVDILHKWVLLLLYVQFDKQPENLCRQWVWLASCRTYCSSLKHKWIWLQCISVGSLNIALYLLQRVNEVGPRVYTQTQHTLNCRGSEFTTINKWANQANNLFAKKLLLNFFTKQTSLFDVFMLK